LPGRHAKPEIHADNSDTHRNAIGDDQHPPDVAVIALEEIAADRAVAMGIVESDENFAHAAVRTTFAPASPERLSRGQRWPGDVGWRFHGSV